MSVGESPTPPPFPAKKSWQFSMRAMMIGMTVFAILCGMTVALPIAFSQLIVGLIWIGATGWLLTGLVFARGDQRAFCIGAAVLVSSTWTGIGGRFLEGIGRILFLLTGGMSLADGLTLWIDHAVIALAAIANGYFCIWARHYFERHSTE